MTPQDHERMRNLERRIERLTDEVRRLRQQAEALAQAIREAAQRGG